MRLKAPGQHYHVIARCNNGDGLLEEDAECVRFLEYLKFYIEKHQVDLFNYVIMPSHVHLLFSTKEKADVDIVMHDICLAVSRDFNKRHSRGGHFWRHRYRSRIIDNDLYALACLRYIDRNPVVAGHVQKPQEWVWSGHKFYAFGEPSDFLKLHPSFALLGDSEEIRRHSYRLFTSAAVFKDKVSDTLFEMRHSIKSLRYRDAYRRTIVAIKQVI